MTTTEITRSESAPRAVAAPATDIFENEGEYLVVTDLPGVSADSLKLVLEKNELVIEGARADDVAGTPLVAAWPLTDFRRVVHVPRGIDASGIRADLRDGVLSVHLPKPATERATRIEVRQA